jgi:LacI family transcriptional regulator
MEHPLSVGIFLPPPQFFATPVVRGIGRYSSAHGPWHITIAAGAEPRYVRRFLRTCDGVIAHLETPLRSLLMASGLPVVGYLSDYSPGQFPLVLPDEDRIGVIGAEHFLERGFRNFGFFGIDANWSWGRERGFVQRLKQAGLSCQTTAPRNAPDLRAVWGELSVARILPRWLKRLAPPAAVMAMNDEAARNIVDACLQMGWRVPEDIAVLGVDNDEMLCNYSAVPLSSVDRNLEQIGFESARLLDRLIRKEAAADEKVAVPPASLVVRRSTAALAINDPDAAAAVRFIAERGCGGIDVDDVLVVVPVSRRALERKLRKAIGRTPAQEIRRVRLARVCELLTETDLPLSDIVPRTGFQYRTYLARAFKKEFGQTPRQFRKKNRPMGHLS